MQTSWYVHVDHTLPWRTRVQLLADLSFGPGRLAVESIETTGGRRIAHLAMIESASVAEFKQAWWYRAFQGTTGSALMAAKIRMTFAQDAYPGEWIDGAILTSRFWLGSHAEDVVGTNTAGSHRMGWRWPELDKQDGETVAVELPTRIGFPFAKYPTIAEFGAWKTVGLKYDRRERLVCTFETYDDKDDRTVGVFPTSVFSDFTAKYSGVMPLTPYAESEWDKRLKEGMRLRMRVYATNCRLPDLYPPMENGRTLLRPEGFVFREVHVQPLEIIWP
jgi:hypothetical protein